MKFTAQNVIECNVNETNDEVTLTLEIGNTDSDVGTVIINMYNTGHENDQGVPFYDVDIQTQNPDNWGLFACANAVCVAVEYFYLMGYDKKFAPLDNTGIDSL